jgi:hypothetical protein
VVAAYDPTAANLQGVGRAVLMRHPKLGADRLAGYALQAGFGFVWHSAAAAGGPAVYAAAYPAGGGSLPNLFDDDQVIVNALTEVRVRPELPVAGRLNWCLTPCCPAAAVLSTALPAPDAPPGETRKVLHGTHTGGLHLTATFSLTDAAEPYQFLLVPRDPAAEPRLTKEQYDDLLNFLDALHPLGVAAVTRSLRRYVHGFRRPPRWDNLPAQDTYLRYRSDHS